MDMSTNKKLPSFPSYHTWQTIFLKQVRAGWYACHVPDAHVLLVSVFMPLQAVVGRQYTIVIVAALISNISFVFAAGYLFK
jgi:hypothetical protein